MHLDDALALTEKVLTCHADLKNTSDDTIPVYLNSLKFRQSHTLTDVRLALGYSALAIAAACFAWDYKFGFDDTKYYTAAAVAVYTVLNTALTLWIWKKEKGVVYVGVAPSGETASFPPPYPLRLSPLLTVPYQITISTSTTKHIPSYNLTITILPKSSSKPETFTVTRPFAAWFDAAGHFVPAPFQTMLAGAIPAVAKLDPKRVAAGPAPPSETTDSRYTAEMLDALTAATATSSEVASGTDGTVGRKGGKRRGKA